MTAKDGGSPPASASALVNITVVNVNDNVPVFDTSLQASKVREDAAVGTRVVRLNATDADGNQLNFSILSGNTDGAFAMHLTSGIISVAAKLDREKIENYTLSVEARDAGGHAVTHNATIQVIDVNDNVPTFQHAAYSKNISENLPAGKRQDINFYTYWNQIMYLGLATTDKFVITDILTTVGSSTESG